MTTIDELRKYRIQLHSPYFNDTNTGIALFDLLATFVVAYLLESTILHWIPMKRITYYLLLIPLGVFVHIITNQQTFFNRQLFTSPNEHINVYQIVFVMISYLLIMSIM